MASCTDDREDRETGLKQAPKRWFPEFLGRLAAKLSYSRIMLRCSCFIFTFTLRPNLARRLWFSLPFKFIIAGKADGSQAANGATACPPRTQVCFFLGFSITIPG